MNSNECFGYDVVYVIGSMADGQQLVSEKRGPQPRQQESRPIQEAERE
jgi:hypothetical protein